MYNNCSHCSMFIKEHFQDGLKICKKITPYIKFTYFMFTLLILMSNLKMYQYVTIKIVFMLSK